MVYPNPSNEELTVEATDDTDSNKSADGESIPSDKNKSSLDYELELLNTYQEIVWKGQLQDGKAKINTKDLPEGTYYLRIINDKESITRRILVKH